jgi:hypothetical protein
MFVYCFSCQYNAMNDILIYSLHPLPHVSAGIYYHRRAVLSKYKTEELKQSTILCINIQANNNVIIPDNWCYKLYSVIKKSGARRLFDHPVYQQNG